MKSIDIAYKIKNRISEIESVEELVSWLNIAIEQKQSDELITEEELISCLFLEDYNKFYRILLTKKNGELRSVYIPNKTLRKILNVLKEIFTILYDNLGSAHGFIIGKSIITNAYHHTGQLLVINIDLKDFFHSISHAMIEKSLLRESYGFAKMNPDILNKIIILCTHYVDYYNQSILPQGSPVSPILSNIVCINLDYALNQFARRSGLKYTRYADDITFSGECRKMPRSFYAELESILKEEGPFSINNKKTRLQYKSGKQKVTGLVVNKKVNVDRKYIKNVRMLLHIYEKFTPLEANNIFKHNSKTNNKLHQVLRGKIEFIGMVKGKNNYVYLKMLERYVIRKDELIKLDKLQL